MVKSVNSSVFENQEGVSDGLIVILRFLENACPQKLQKFKFEKQDCSSFPFLRRLCLCIGIENLMVVHSAKEICKSELMEELPTSWKQRSESHSDEEMDLELTGQPLECTFGLVTPNPYCAENPQINEQQKFTLLPVKLEEAREFLGLYNSIALEKMESHLFVKVPLVVLCDGKDSERTILVGSFCRNKFITTLAASVKGPFLTKDLPSLSSLEEEHLQPFHPCFSGMTETEVFCRYDVLESEYREDIECSSLAITCNWKKATSLLESPSANAICKLVVKVIPGEERSPAFAIYKELSFLKRLLQGLKSGEVVWSTEPSDTSVLDKVSHLISGVKDGCHWRKTESQKTSTVADTLNFDSFLEAVVMGKRQNVEFTDHLWTALTGCTSYAELKESLELVVDAIKERTIQPVVLHTNKTTLGNWIKRMSADEFDSLDVSLEGTAPLKLLLEMGIEKLKKDYSVVFVGLGLATEESLQPFLVDSSNLEEMANLLHKLHCTLELIVMCKTDLQLSREILGGFVRQTVKFYSSVDTVLPSHQFQFPVQLSAVRKTIGALQPVEWEVFFKTSTENYSAFTCCQLSIEPPVGYLNATRDSTSDVKKNEFEYFCTTVCCVQDYSLFE